MADDWVLQILRVLRHFLAGLEFHVRFLPIRTVTGELSPTALLTRVIRSADGIDFHFEDRLHRLFHFRLRGLRRDLEYQRVLVFLDAEAFLGNHRLADDLVCRFHLRDLRRLLRASTRAARRLLRLLAFTLDSLLLASRCRVFQR